MLGMTSGGSLLERMPLKLYYYSQTQGLVYLYKDKFKYQAHGESTPVPNENGPIPPLQAVLTVDGYALISGHFN